MISAPWSTAASIQTRRSPRHPNFVMLYSLEPPLPRTAIKRGHGNFNTMIQRTPLATPDDSPTVN